MTNEKGLFAQAGLRNVRGSTIERKIMSTKTITKRIALVAASALAIGGFSAVSANAANNAAILYSSINLKVFTSSPKTGAAVLINQGETTVAGVTPAATDTSNFTAYLSSVPTGGSTITTGTYATCADGATAPTKPVGLGGAPVGTGTPTVELTGTVGGATATNGVAVTASSTACTSVWSFTPSVAGTYVLTVFADSNADGIAQATEVTQTASITVAAATAFSANASTAYATTPAAGGAGANAATSAIERSAAKASGTGIEQIKVTLLKSDGTADTSGAKVTADISGVGYVSVGDSTTVNTIGAATTRSASDSTADTIRYVHVNADGTGGAGSVTVSVTDPTSLAKTVLGTFSYTAYGNITKLAVSSTNYSIGRAGFTTGNGTIAARSATHEVGVTAGVTPFTALVTTPAFIVEATDSSGNPVAVGATPFTISSADATVVSGGACQLDDGSDPIYSSSTNGVGYYNCNFTTPQGAVTGSKTSLTIKILDPNDPLGLAYITTTFPVTVGGSVAKEVLSTDKSSYAPGEGMTINVTATDSKGNPVYDGAAAVGAITASKSLGGTAFAPALYVGGKASSTGSTGVKTVYAPPLAGAFTLNATGTDLAATALSATATVGSVNDAQIASLITKINALAALIAKIQKKLGVK